MAVNSDQVNCARRSSFGLLSVLLTVALVGSASAQSQASCQFSSTFNRHFLNSSNTGYVDLGPSGINDYGTVVGYAQDEVTFSIKGFTRWSNGTINYYQHSSNGTAMATFLMDRSNGGTTIGVTGGQFALAYLNGTPFTLQGSTVTPITMTIGGTTYKQFTVSAINHSGTMVGTFKDASGKIHAFKRSGNGSAVALDYPGAAETMASGINDNGTVVGTYSKTLPPHDWRQGFIYSSGKWATLNYPNSGLQTMLNGISNANLIIATTVQSSNALNSYIYLNGVFKKIVLPNSMNPTYAFGVSLGNGLITGFSGYTGYIASCK